MSLSLACSANFAGGVSGFGSSSSLEPDAGSLPVRGGFCPTANVPKPSASNVAAEPLNNSSHWRRPVDACNSSPLIALIPSKPLHHFFFETRFVHSGCHQCSHRNGQPPRMAFRRNFQCYTPSLVKIMSSNFKDWWNWSSFSLANVLHLAAILVIALILNRLLRVLTKLLVRPAASQSRAAQSREQQTRTLAGVLYSAGSKIVWAVAILMALYEFGINVTPVAALAGLASLALGFGAQNLIRDIITGFYIVLEDQYVVGDTIQVGETLGRVEHVTLRRTVVRDARGALVTISNGDIRTVGNLSRDWSQAFADIALAPESPLDKTLLALEAAAAELRADPSWSQALVDGPRILGVQSIDRSASTVRLQVRTVPTRQDEVARELRRRIQIEFQKQGIPLSSVQRFEWANPAAVPQPGVASASGASAALFATSKTLSAESPETR